MQWLQDYWYSTHVREGKYLYYMAVHAAAQVANYKQMEDLNGVPQEHRLFKTPNQISSLIAGMVSRAETNDLHERLRLEGRLEEYLFYQNLVVDDGDSNEYPGAGDEFSGNDPYDEDALDRWSRWVKSIQADREMEIAMAALAALEDVHGE